MATFVATCQMAIGNYKFSAANYVEINNSLFELADTAIVRLPSLKNSLDVASKFNKGDLVSISLGYLGMNKNYQYDEFKGFVKEVKPNVPVEIVCEDAVWLMRKVNCSVLLKDTSLKGILNYLVSQTNNYWKGQYKIDLANNVPSIAFDKYRISNVNAASVLQELKEKYGLVAYFRDFTLHVELPYFEYLNNSSGDVKYSFAWNILPKPNLTYKSGKETNIRLKAIALQKDNKRITVEVGDPNGELRTKIYYNIPDKDTLTKVAQNDLGQFKVDSLEGTFKTKLVPFCRPGYSAKMEDPEYNGARAGTYAVEKVKTVLSMNEGIVRTITPGRRLV